MPWNRNVTLALEIQEEMRNPLKLAEINEQIPTMMKELAQMPIEDEEFVFSPWSPTPIRKTLLPVPEQVLEPVDALGDAHEAMLESMESEVLVVDEVIEIQQEESVVEQSESPEQDIEEQVQQKPTPKSTVSNSTDIEHLHIIMNKLGLNDSYEHQGSVAEQVQQIRRSLAKNVGLEPRDIRVDRLLRLILRLLPQSNEQDGRRKLLIMKLATGLKRYQNWIKRRLEARHKAAKDNLMLDSETLGNALQRIPGPGFKVPLEKDEKVLPGFDEIEELSAEVEILLSTLNLDSASGVVVSAQ